MKKLLLCLLALVLVVSMTACKTTNENSDENLDGNVAEGEVNDGTTDGETEGEAASVAANLKEIFVANISDEATAEEIANKIIENAALPFMAGAMTVEEGFLTGFDNAEIKGFEDGAVFMPMIGSIPFVGYIFKLPADADVEAFKTNLTDNANLRWNICVTADEMLVANEGNTVFFIMCPASFDEPEAEGDMPEMLDDGFVDDGLAEDGFVDDGFVGDFDTVVDDAEAASLDNEVSADFFAAE